MKICCLYPHQNRIQTAPEETEYNFLMILHSNAIYAIHGLPLSWIFFLRLASGCSYLRKCRDEMQPHEWPTSIKSQQINCLLYEGLPKPTHHFLSKFAWITNWCHLDLEDSEALPMIRWLREWGTLLYSSWPRSRIYIEIKRWLWGKDEKNMNLSSLKVISQNPNLATACIWDVCL